MRVFSKVRESRGRPIHRWNRAELYFTASSRYTTEVFYCYKLRGHMSFFRANLIGLKADRDKKEIGTWCRSRGQPRTHACTQQQQLLHQHACRFMHPRMPVHACIMHHACSMACSMHAGSCMPVHACRPMHAGSCQLLLMRACARATACVL